PGLLVDNPKDLLAVASLRLRGVPSSQVLRHRIHERNVAVHIGGDHGVADTFQRPFQPLALFGHRPYGLPLLGHIVKGEQHAARGRLRADSTSQPVSRSAAPLRKVILPSGSEAITASPILLSVT